MQNEELMARVRVLEIAQRDVSSRRESTSNDVIPMASRMWDEFVMPGNAKLDPLFEPPLFSTSSVLPRAPLVLPFCWSKSKHEEGTYLLTAGAYHFCTLRSVDNISGAWNILTAPREGNKAAVETFVGTAGEAMRRASAKFTAWANDPANLSLVEMLVAKNEELAR